MFIVVLGIEWEIVFGIVLECLFDFFMLYREDICVKDIYNGVRFKVKFLMLYRVVREFDL